VVFFGIIGVLTAFFLHENVPLSVPVNVPLIEILHIFSVLQPEENSFKNDGIQSTFKALTNLLKR